MTQIVFKNCAPFIIYITKIDGTTIHDAENLYMAIPMYNLLEFSSNYSKTTGSLYNLLQEIKQLILILMIAIMILNLFVIRVNYQEIQLQIVIIKF